MPAQCSFYEGSKRRWGPLPGQLCLATSPASFSIKMPENPEDMRPGILDSDDLVDVKGPPDDFVASSEVNSAGQYYTLQARKQDVTGCVYWTREHATLCARAVNR